MSTEGCSSSESGWTMYIDSPMQEDEADCSTSYNEGDKKKILVTYPKDAENDEDEDAGSDDSMASDASSGPTNHHHFQSHREYNQDPSRCKHDKKQFSTQNNKTKKEKRVSEKSTRRK